METGRQGRAKGGGHDPRHTPSLLAALVRAEEHARKAYEFSPGSYTYAALTAIRRALKLLGGKTNGSE